MCTLHPSADSPDMSTLLLQSPASAMMRQVVSKMARKTQQQSQQPLGGGKENSTIFDAPSAPTHRINANASAAPASRYETLFNS